MKLPHWIHHDWGRWQQYQETGTMIQVDLTALGMSPTPVDYAETRQRRLCQRCGTMQDRLVKKGPLVDAERLARQRVGET